MTPRVALDELRRLIVHFDARDQPTTVDALRVAVRAVEGELARQRAENDRALAKGLLARAVLDR